MSYSIDVSFKNCEREDVYNNIENFSNLIYKYRYDIIRQNGWYIPFGELSSIYEKTQDVYYVKIIIRKWLNHLFNHKIYYSDKIKSLCFVWNNYACKIDEIKNWFDGYVGFQDSCDQDYDYSEWQFNKTFKEYIDKVESLNDEQFKELYKEINGDNFDDWSETGKVDDYDKRTLVYKMCYNDVSNIWDSPIALHTPSDFDEYFDETLLVIRILCGLEHLNRDACLEETHRKWREIFHIEEK